MKIVENVHKFHHNPSNIDSSIFTGEFYNAEKAFSRDDVSTLFVFCEDWVCLILAL